MLETLSVFQWSILALAALCIGMSKTGGLVFTEPPDASGNRNRSLARNPYGKTLPRKSLPKIHPDCHNTFCCNDARIASENQFVTNFAQFPNPTDTNTKKGHDQQSLLFMPIKTYYDLFYN